jgi:hypothetical protein
MVQTLKVSFAIGRHVPQGGFAYWNEGRWEKPLGSRIMVVNVLREPRKGVILQPQTEEELYALLSSRRGMISRKGMISVLRPQGEAIKGEL